MILYKWIFIPILSWIGLSPFCVAQGGGNESSGLFLTSKTALPSAAIYVRERDGKDQGASQGKDENNERKMTKPSEQEKKDDRARRVLGIGETVTVTLKGKPSLIDPIKDIQWSIDKGRDLLEPIDEMALKGVTELSLSVKATLTKDKVKENIQISVKVKQEEHSPAPIQFSVIFPNKLTARHIPSGGNSGTCVSNYIDDGSWLCGASAKLHIIVGPDNVNFSNITVVEKDGKTTPPLKTQGSLVTPHPADSEWGITPTHDLVVPDNIGYRVSDDKLADKSIKYPNNFSWKCLFKTGDGTTTADSDGKWVPNSFELIEAVTQTFSIEEVGIFTDKIYKVKVSKFSNPTCTVERTQGESHIYSTQSGPNN